MDSWIRRSYLGLSSCLRPSSFNGLEHRRPFRIDEAFLMIPFRIGRDPAASLYQNREIVLAESVEATVAEEVPSGKDSLGDQDQFHRHFAVHVIVKG